MKITQSPRMDHSKQKTQRTNSVQNKENEPVNLDNTSKEVKFKTTNTKIGQQIRNKINRMASSKQSQSTAFKSIYAPLQQIIPKELSNSKCQSNKSVTFDGLDRSSSSSIINRHNSKKSILKNSVSNMKKSSCSLGKSQISCSNSHVVNYDQSVEHQVGNRTIKQKYEKIMQEMKRKHSQYTDDIYPPCKSSIYLNNSLMKNFIDMFEKEGRAVEWMRIADLFKNHKLTVWTPKIQDKSYILKGHISKNSGDGDFLPNAFNLIKQKKSILQKMFECQQINKQGVYYVKIHQTQTNIWKYVVIDDYIPIIVNTKIDIANRYLPENVYPAFLNVQAYGEILEIWPFLLQKAYAKYYSSYDSLGNGNTFDFVQEITGVMLQTHKIKDNLQKINSLLKNQDTLLLGEDKAGQLYPFKNIINQSSQKRYLYLDRNHNFIQQAISYEQFHTKFKSIHSTYLHKYFYTSNCLIKQQNVKVRATDHEKYILRHIKIEEQTQCQIGVIQKQQRFYRSYLTYEYVWFRIILVQKESNSYRWIDSTYSNKKTIKLTANLSPGEYVIIMMPEWKQKCYDFNLMYMGSSNVTVQRKSYENYHNIIQESCMDLAQRLGKLSQVNKNICSYHYIQKNIGFVIENINNEKQFGNVRVLRSIEGLQNFNITPINPEFRSKGSIQIVIPKQKHFTVVLMTNGGVQTNFLQMFDFGL